LGLVIVAATLAVVPIAFGVGFTTNQQWLTSGRLLTVVAAVMVPANLVAVVQLLQEWGNMKMKNTKLLALALLISVNVQLVRVGGMLS
jgi:4-amino-4-deoxy-L-arabinose transferase-like glycosyltransferase